MVGLDHQLQHVPCHRVDQFKQQFNQPCCDRTLQNLVSVLGAPHEVVVDVVDRVRRIIMVKAAASVAFRTYVAQETKHEPNY